MVRHRNAPIENGKVQTGSSSSSEGGVTPAASTEFGHVQHVKVQAGGGAPGIENANWGRKAVPAGDWEVVKVWFVLRGNGTQGDTIRCYVTSPIDSYLTESIDISAKSEGDVVNPQTFDYANASFTSDGSTLLMAAFGTSNGNDCPPFDMHAELRQTA